MEHCHVQQVCFQAAGYCPPAPEHFEVLHQKYEETTEEALQTSYIYKTHTQRCIQNLQPET